MHSRRGRRRSGENGKGNVLPGEPGPLEVRAQVVRRQVRRTYVILADGV